MKKLVTTYHLQLKEKTLHQIDLQDSLSLVECREISPEFAHFLFNSVGGNWNWYSRLKWDYDTWRSYLARSNVRTWVLYSNGNPAGYFELVKHDDAVEVMFFGLLPQYYGKGLGTKLLNCATNEAWNWSAQSIWLHTCDEDHPNALQNYLNKGFVLMKEEVNEEDVPTLIDDLKLTPEFVFSTLKHHSNVKN